MAKPSMGTDLIKISTHSIGQPEDSASRPLPAGFFLQQPDGSRIPAKGGTKTFCIETFGCQMNDHDSEKVAGVLMARGYRPVEDSSLADLVLYNTCSIRERAAQKVFSHLGAIKKVRPDNPPIIGVLGCVAQQEGDRIFERAPQVSLVCGSASYSRLPDLLDRLESGQRRVTGLSLDIDECFETEITRRDNPFRAYLTIIEGCDKACSYCVVPMTRGPERSRRSDGILADCRRLADEGFTEIQLLGQTVNSYRDPSPAHLSFAELLVKVAEVHGIRRVRFTTSHPGDFTPEIVRAIESTPALCNQIHLPVQSGSDTVLARMRRTYTRADYLAKIDCIHHAKRAISISTDIIVGFCGETEKDFEQTLSLLSEVEYDLVYSFKYSPRPITAAGGWPDDVPEEEKGRRLAAVQELQREIQLRRNSLLIGSEVEVLVEGFQPRQQQVVGRTTRNQTVNFPGTSSLVGRYLNVRVTGAGPHSLMGTGIE